MFPLKNVSFDEYGTPVLLFKGFTRPIAPTLVWVIIQSNNWLVGILFSADQKMHGVKRRYNFGFELSLIFVFQNHAVMLVHEITIRFVSWTAKKKLLFQMTVNSKKKFVTVTERIWSFCVILLVSMRPFNYSTNKNTGFYAFLKPKV